MFTGFCWFFWSCPLDSAWSSASASLESRWFFCKFFWWSSCDAVVNLQHSGLDLWHSGVLILTRFLVFWSCRCLCPWMSPLRLVLVLALALWIIWMILTRGTGWPPGLCAICSRRSLPTGLPKMAGAMCTALVCSHMPFWKAGCAGSYLFSVWFFSFLYVFVVYFCFFLLCWLCFFNSGTCLGWRTIWAVVDLLASGNGSA